MNLDNLTEIKQLDSKNMLGSLQLLGKQIKQVLGASAKLKVPVSYEHCNAVVVLGMGGSTLGSHVIKSVFQKDLKVPFEIVNGYHVPGFVNKQTLVVVSSYSGTTEEPLFAMKEAKKRGAKMLAITSGGALADVAKKQKIPALIFSAENNPCGSPRMGLGYSVVGQMVLLAKAGVLKISNKQFEQMISVIDKYSGLFGVAKDSQHNIAKHIAQKTQGRTVWYVGAEHLAGSAHVGSNQMNENAKRFAGYFLVPEMNHHLMEGMMQPASNKDTLLFILLESKKYDARIQKRFAVTKGILDKNGIAYVHYEVQEKDPLLQVCEVLVLTSFASYYSALLQGIDPTAIPFVDFFKEQLKK